jgi:uncharacterized membrane protein YdjX (TVP38/TMEM64 family)
LLPFSLKKTLPLAAMIILFASFFCFHLYRYLSFENLHTHRKLLLQWKDENYLITVCTYILLYIAGIAAFLPCNLFFSLVGGFLFGLLPGIIYILFSATLGSTLAFLAIKLALADWLPPKTESWRPRMEHGFKKNAFHYLLSLRLIPFFPFAVVNTVAGLLGIKARTFIGATLIGSSPAGLIYASVGHSLETAFNAVEVPTLTIIFQPHFLWPLLGLAFLASFSVIYNYFKNP